MLPLMIIIDSIFKIDCKLPYIAFFILNVLIIVAGNKKNIVILFFTDLIILTQFIYLKDMLDLNELMLYCDFILIIIYSVTNKGINLLKEILFQYKNAIYITCLIILLIFLFSFLSGTGWIYLWEGKQFIGVISFPHDACYFFAGMQGYFIFFYFTLKKTSNKVICFAANTIFFIFALLTNARTPFIVSAFLFLYFIYKVTYKKYMIIYFIITIPIGLLLIAILFNKIKIEFIYNLPIINKFFVTMSRGDITSSRDIMWENILYIYDMSFTTFNKFIGKGTFFTQSINKVLTGNLLWAHNDFLEILVGIGYYGMALYILAITFMIKKVKNIFWGIVLILAAFFNGVFVYRKIIVFIPIIVYVLTFQSNENKKFINRKKEFYEKSNVFNSKP
ncbi:hypothetical protein JCM1393_06720 [Clostridium carnis]